MRMSCVLVFPPDGYHSIGAREARCCLGFVVYELLINPKKMILGWLTTVIPFDEPCVVTKAITAGVLHKSIVKCISTDFVLIAI